MKRFFIGILFLLVLLLPFFYLYPASKGGDIFSGYVLEGKPVEIQDAVVLADTDCTPNKEYTTLTCTAIINANGEILKVRYTHPIDVPCLSRGDKVNISIQQNSTLRIVRMSKPSMKH
ncbi:hypothetical protein OCC_05706 [Thermococcus litoralis DSM 5473]|uniref:Uncharacterized protein n=1 Tax=Thermococcus litoralis (strain ATCC 51850 / DSM 5473 / JCM 8560 / NS-C) TaxID=523849 RepID=H3ZMT9_THELN|nr:hypothetical protein [Thermococcus litoralis]EHR78736.1 hypothetical protein OCC_05706 [Thermococcus litoralis DSM 5473]